MTVAGSLDRLRSSTRLTVALRDAELLAADASRTTDARSDARRLAVVVEDGDDIMSIPGAEDTIDPATFEQILEMDEDEVDREFSKSIVFDFFGQADSTFAKMDSSLWVPHLPLAHLPLTRTATRRRTTTSRR